ncbi:unnamed protein product [Cochlearia groenlandica]
MGDEEEEEERLVWKFKVEMRVRRLNLKLNLLQNRFYSWKLHRFSLLLRFRNHHLRINSHSKPKPKPRFRFGFLRTLLLRRQVKNSQEELIGHKINKLPFGFSNKAKLRVGGLVIVVTIIFIIISLAFP